MKDARKRKTTGGARRRGRNTLAAVAVGLLAAAAFAVAASADDISNNLDATIDTNAEVMALNVGGTNGTTQLYVTPRNGDGKSGCNLTGGTTLVVSVASSDTSVATVSPSSVTFTSCGDTPTLAVTPHSKGSATISVSQWSNNTGDTFNFAPATFTVNVAPPANSAPSVRVTGFDAPLLIELGADSEPTPGCSATDAEDGPSSPTPAIDRSVNAFGLGTVTVTCSYTDAGGLTATDSKSYSIVDTTAPTITATRVPADANFFGWNNSEVTVHFECDDSGSGVVSCPADLVLREGANQSADGTVYDNAGNHASASVSDINVDTTKPDVALIGGPAAGASYFWGFLPTAPTCHASDALSGLAGPCSMSAYSQDLGEHTVTASATDEAGNSASDSRTYTVDAWKLGGFYQPVDMNGVFNTAKGGSTVPLKFELFAGSELTNVADVKSVTSAKVACDLSAATDDIEAAATGGTSLRYDTAAGLFMYNWQTPKTAGSCYRVTMTARDGSSISALFKLK